MEEYNRRIMTDKSKAQQDSWVEVVIKESNSPCTDYLKESYSFQKGVEWTLNNLDKVPQVKELIESLVRITRLYLDHEDIDMNGVRAVAIADLAIAKFKEGK